MTQINTLLELRTKIKDKKPVFIRQDYHRRKRLGRKLKWRKPKGIHSKIRHHFKGRRKMPSPGYKSPAQVAGLSRSGLKIVNVSSANDLQKIRSEAETAVISKTVGMKKRLEILKKAKELNIGILNLNADEHIAKIENFLKSKKEAADKGKKEAKKSAKEPKEQKEAEQGTDIQRKDAEKKEKDRVLTKRI